MQVQVHESTPEIGPDIGTLFCVSLSGTVLTEEEQEIFARIRPGAFLLFGRNCESAQQVRDLTDAIRSLAGESALIAIDQEGGRVDRLRNFISPMPSAELAARAGGMQAARHLGNLTGRLLRSLGINFNFAPVLDLYHGHDQRHPGNSGNQQENGLATRYFGKTAEEVTQNAAAYLEAMQREGITGCLKHFPGLGGAESDPHKAFPLVRRTQQQLLESDLIPFERIIRQELAEAVMISHAAYPALEESNTPVRPASLSPRIVNGWLRGQLNFQGLSLSDDLRMEAAIQAAGSLEQAAMMAFEAGEDMLLLCTEAEEVRHVHDYFLRALPAVPDWKQRVRESVDRIHAIQQRSSAPGRFDETMIAEISAEIFRFHNELIRKENQDAVTR